MDFLYSDLNIVCIHNLMPRWSHVIPRDFPLLFRTYHISYECVECGTGEEDEIISDLIFEDSHLKLTNTIYHFPSLQNSIEKFDNGFKFTRLNKKEYADLKNIVNRLKQFIKDNNIE